MKVFVFPGQGTQRAGMLRQLRESYDAVKDIFDTASELSGIDMQDLCTNQNDDVLAITSNTQLAVTAMNLSYPSTVTLSQSFLPNHLGTASGISYGLTTCIGGIASPGLGIIGDTYGLVTVFLAMACVAAVSLVFALIVVGYERKSKV